MGRAAPTSRLRSRGRGSPDLLLAEFLEELGERVASDPDGYRWDYIEALVVCRKEPANS
jgi:hypothetical protein